MHNAAIGADRDIDAGLLIVFIAGFGNLDNGGCLAAANALGFAGDADGAAANADLDKVCTGFCQEQEALAVHHVACTDLYLVAVMLTDPGDGTGLPFAVTFGRVDAEHIHAGIHQGGHALGIVAGIDAGADNIALVGIQQLIGMFLVGIIIFAENHILQVALLVYQRQRVDLVIPDDIVAVMQAGVGRCGNQLVQRGHELSHFQIGAHAGQAVVTGCHNAQQLAVGGAVSRDGNGGMAGTGFQVQHISQGSLRRQVGIRGNKALFVSLDTANHISLGLNGLGAVNERNAALLGKGNGELLTGNGLHDSRNHGDVHGQGAGFFALAVLDQRGFEADSRGDALRRGIAGDEQILAEGTGRFTKIIRHFAILLYPFRCLICLLVIVPHSRTICKICCIKSFFGLLGKSCINCTMARHKSMTNQNILHIGTRPPFGTGSKRVPACRTCDALFPAHSSKFRVISPSAASRITALAALLLAL